MAEIDSHIYYDYSPYSAGDLPRGEMLALTERFKKLSQPLLDILSSVNVAEYIWTLGNANNLSEEQTAAVAISIRELILGDISLDQFPQVLSERLSLDLQWAQQLAQFIEHDILNPILPELQKKPSEERTSSTPSQDIGKNNIIDLRKLSE